LVRFLCGVPKKMIPAVGAGPDGVAYLDLKQRTFSTVGSRPDSRLAFFTGLKKVSKEMTALAAGMTVRLAR